MKADGYFYLVSQPRSRSTWFSMFFSTSVSYCYHELLSTHAEDAAKTLLNTKRPFVGSADTNPISVLKYDVPLGPIVIVKRPLEDVHNSMINAFDAPEGYTQEEWEIAMKNVIDGYDIAMDVIERNAHNVLTVEFKDLDDIKLLKKIFGHCVPGFEPNDGYLSYMNNLKITGKERGVMTKSIKKSAERMGRTYEGNKEMMLNFDKEKFRRNFLPNAMPGDKRIVDIEGNLAAERPQIIGGN